jgi:hypothetical protein
MVRFLQKKLPGGNRRLPFVVLTVFLVLAAVFAEVFVFTSLNHDQSGEHCSDCLQIEIAHLLERLGCICFFAFAACLIPRTSVIIKRCLCFFAAPQTLIALKIKYNS